MNLAAGVWIRKLASRPLERECLAAYLNHNLARWGGPEYQFFLGGALYCLGIVFYFFTDDMYGHTKIMLRVLYVAVTIAGWVILAVFTTNIYAAAANLKENSSDSELKNFGQILALSTIGVLLWELYKSYKGKQHNDINVLLI